MELNLKLTEKDYRAIASDRASRFSHKYKDRKLSAIEWLGLFGVLLATIPAILGSVNNLDVGGAEAAAMLGIFALLGVLVFLRAGHEHEIKNQILAKWGIKNKKGERWASK